MQDDGRKIQALSAGHSVIHHSYTFVFLILHHHLLFTTTIITTSRHGTKLRLSLLFSVRSFITCIIIRTWDKTFNRVAWDKALDGKRDQTGLKGSFMVFIGYFPDGARGYERDRQKEVLP